MANWEKTPRKTQDLLEKHWLCFSPELAAHVVRIYRLVTPLHHAVSCPISWASSRVDENNLLPPSTHTHYPKKLHILKVKIQINVGSG